MSARRGSVPPASSGKVPLRIFPLSLQDWAVLGRKAVYGSLDDRAAPMGAAIAYYTVFSLAPILVMVVAVAGLAFGEKAAEGALLAERADLVGIESARAIEAMLISASGTRSGIIATAVGIAALIIAATAVFVELQTTLNVIWKTPTTASRFKSRLAPRGGH
jgi:membrane protein